MQFSTEAVRELAQLLNDSGLHEISIAAQSDDAVPVRIVVRSTPAPAPAPRPVTVVQTIAPTADAPADAASTLLVPATDDGTLLSEEGEGPVEIEKVIPTVPVTATAVGLFQLATGVNLGDEVKKGQILAYVESLKIPNEVCAPQAGRLADVLVADGLGVEYGQTLLLLEVDA